MGRVETPILIDPTQLDEKAARLLSLLVEQVHKTNGNALSANVEYKIASPLDSNHHIFQARTVILTKSISIVDPTKLDDENTVLLNALLQQSSEINREILNSNTPFPISYAALNEKQVPVKRGALVVLTRTLIRRVKTLENHSLKQEKYSIKGDQIGRGVYGSVYKVLGVLRSKNNNKIELKTNKKRVVKVQLINEGTENEAAIAAAIPYLHAKPATIDNQRKYSYLVEDEFEKETLEQIIEKDKSGTSVLPLAKRIQLAINLLRGLQFIQLNGVVHRDIKPGNIIVDLTTDAIRIIDFGFSRFRSQKDRFLSGSPGYMAPEAFTHSMAYNQTSDTYSMGMVLRELFRANPRVGSVDDVKKSILAGIEPANLDALFKDILDLSEDQKAIIEFHIRSMAIFNQANRATCKEGIEIFEQIKLQLKLADIPKQHWNEIELVNALALKIQAESDQLSANFSSQQTDINQRLTKINESLQRIDYRTDYSAYQMAELTDSLGVAAFKSCKTIQEIKSIIDATLSEFAPKLETIKKLRERAQSLKQKPELRGDALAQKDKDLDVILFEIDLFMKKIQRYLLKFDDIRHFNLKLDKVIALQEGRLNDLEAGRNVSFDRMSASIVPTLAKTQRPVAVTLFQEANALGSSGHNPVGADGHFSTIKSSELSLEAIKRRINTSNDKGLSQSLVDLRKSVRKAIVDYIDAYGKRADTDRRKKDIISIITAVEESNNEVTLVNNVNTSLRRIETGYFGFSALRNNVQKVLDDRTQFNNGDKSARPSASSKSN